MGVGVPRKLALAVVAIVGAFLIASAAAAIAAMLFAMRSGWTAPSGFSPAVVFWNERVPHAAQWWPRLLAMLLVWAVGLVALVATLVVLALRAPRRIAGTIIGGQIVLLAAFVVTPMPLDADQYAYVAYGDLTDLGRSPYDPPLRSAPLPGQLHEIATVWSNNEGAPNRVVVRDKYGPALTLLMAAALRPFLSASPEEQARVLRVLAALAAVGSSVLLWGELHSRPWGLAALAAVALNPIVVMQPAIGAHDDVFAVLPALAAYRLAVRGRSVGAAACLGLSIACKLTFAPFALPLLAFTFANRRLHVTIAAAAVLIAIPLLFALPFGWYAALVRTYQDAARYNSSLVSAYLGVAVGRATHLPILAELVRRTAAPAAIAACTVLVTALALRRTRRPSLEVALLLLLFVGARQQTWYALNLIPVVLVPRVSTVGVFLGCSLASEAIQRKNFIGGWDAPPFIPFVLLAVLVSLGLAIALRTLARRSAGARDGDADRRRRAPRYAGDHPSTSSA